MQQDGTPDDMVLVRVYGNSTDKFIDRDAEISNVRAPNIVFARSRVNASCWLK